MDVIQSAIMTSSLINLPRAMGKPGLWSGPRTHMHTEAAVSVISRHCVSGLWDHGKVSHFPKGHHYCPCWVGTGPSGRVTAISELIQPKTSQPLFRTDYIILSDYWTVKIS